MPLAHITSGIDFLSLWAMELLRCVLYLIFKIKFRILIFDLSVITTLIVQHRKELVELVHKAISILKSDKAGPGPQSRMPSYGTQVFYFLYILIMRVSG